MYMLSVDILQSTCVILFYQLFYLRRFWALMRSMFWGLFAWLTLSKVSCDHYRFPTSSAQKLWPNFGFEALLYDTVGACVKSFHTELYHKRSVSGYSQRSTQSMSLLALSTDLRDINYRGDGESSAYVFFQMHISTADVAHLRCQSPRG